MYSQYISFFLVILFVEFVLQCFPMILAISDVSKFLFRFMLFSNSFMNVSESMLYWSNN